MSQFEFVHPTRFLRRQLGTRRLRLIDNDRRRLATRAYCLGRRALRDIATIDIGVVLSALISLREKSGRGAAW